MKKRSYKSKIREYMESRVLDLQDRVHQKEAEVIKILMSDHKDWPRVQKLAEEANGCVEEWAVLKELWGLKKSQIPIEDKFPI